MLNEGVQIQNTLSWCKILFMCIYGKSKTIVTICGTAVARVMHKMKWLISKGNKGTFGVDGICHDYGHSDKLVYVCQVSLNCTLKIGKF